MAAGRHAPRTSEREKIVVVRAHFSVYTLAALPYK
jgi:hypothetical protein